ncbi:MAG: hypothetical protein QXT45_04805 [Candidatus Bilamarchaeaceae archaeon]
MKVSVGGLILIILLSGIASGLVGGLISGLIVVKNTTPPYKEVVDDLIRRLPLRDASPLDDHGNDPTE